MADGAAMIREYPAFVYCRPVMEDFIGKRAGRGRAWLLAAALLSMLYGAFEFGRRDAGGRAASARIRELEVSNELQRRKLAAADVAQRIDREAYKQVERNLGDLQSQIARLKQDLSFYRGLVQPDSLVDVRVQQMQIVPETTSGAYRLKFVLMQTGSSDRAVAGSAFVSIEGSVRGRPVTLGMSEAAPAHRTGLNYSFRYFQNYDEPVRLPPGFEPARISIEIRTGRDAIHVFRQAFVWKAQGISTETDPPGYGISREAPRDDTR
ncbi:MAG: hypothetical protein NVSMB10_13080 [Steroidobacteraceae bacterium]